MSFPAYDEYRDTGVSWLGELPKHWQSGALCRIACRVVVGIAEAATHAYADSGTPILRATNIRASRIIGELHHVNKDYSDGRESKQLQGGDLVTVRTGNAGVTAIIPDELDGCQCFTMLITTLDSNSSSEFYCYWLNSLSAQAYFTLEGWGTAQINISVPILKGLQVPMPPPDEQTAIACFLDIETSKIDALVSEQRRLIELLKENRQAVVSHAVTKGLNPNAPMKPSGIRWLGDVPEHWSVATVRRVLASIEQGWSPLYDSRSAEEDEWGILKTGCVNRGVFSEIENKALPKDLEPIVEYEVKVGDVLMSRASGSPDLVGATAFVYEIRPHLMLSDKTFRIRLAETMEPEFFVAVFNSLLMRAQIEQSISGAGGLANNLPQSKLRCFVLALPPVTEQQEIVKELHMRCGRFDSLVSEAERAIELLQERRTALISAAVTGKIDVREFAYQETA